MCIIQGLRDDGVKMRLLDLNDGELTLENSIKICRTSELTQKQLKVLSKEEAPVHFVTRGGGRGNG